MGRKEIVMESINKEIELFQNALDGLEEQLVASVLLDILATNIKVTKDKEGNREVSFDGFDEKVENLKQMLIASYTNDDPIQIDIINSISDSIDRVIETRKECMFSLRSLTWAQKEIENGEKDSND